MGAASTLLSTIVYHTEPDCKGWHAYLARSAPEEVATEYP